MWDGETVPKQIMKGSECQIEELELYPVVGKSYGTVFKNEDTRIRSVLVKDTGCYVDSIEGKN